MPLCLCFNLRNFPKSIAYYAVIYIFESLVFQAGLINYLAARTEILFSLVKVGPVYYCTWAKGLQTTSPQSWP